MKTGTKNKSNNPDNSSFQAKTLLDEGADFHKNRQYKDALICFEKATELEPGNARAWHCKAEAQVMCLKYMESLESCTKALSIDPKNSKTWFLLSFAQGVLGQYKEALDSCTKGLDLDPSNNMVWCTRGQYLYALGRLEEALQSFGMALKMNPESAYFKEVTTKLTKWLQRDGQSSEWANTVMNFLQKGGYKEALETYQQSLKVDPRSVTRTFEKDFALAHLENPEKILKDYEKTKVQDQPQLQMELSQKEFEFSRESWVEVTIANKGNTPARDLSFSFSSEVVMKPLDVSPDVINQIKHNKSVDLDTIPELSPGNQVKKLISLMPKKIGQFSLEATICYTDVWGVKQSKSSITWISSFKPNEQLPTISGYKMLWRLNTTESATIYIAQRMSDSSRVVIKITNFNSDQSSLCAEFINETRQCARLLHPNIIKIYQFGDKPSPWVSMEYMSKGSLSRKIGRLSLMESLLIAYKITDALAYARTMRITHRSISPDNVLFDANDVPKLTNWRVGSITQKLHNSNSPSELVTAYYPPEKLFGGLGGVDWFSDIYQLGVLYYEMLTGSQPFQSKGDELISDIGKGNISPPKSRNSAIPENLNSLVLQCLSKYKKDRYQSVSSLKLALENVIKKVKINNSH
jgi:tetratricopeptide (TPR) repeat protein